MVVGLEIIGVMHEHELPRVACRGTFGKGDTDLRIFLVSFLVMEGNGRLLNLLLLQEENKKKWLFCNLLLVATKVLNTNLYRCTNLGLGLPTYSTSWLWLVQSKTYIIYILHKIDLYLPPIPSNIY